LVTLFWSFLHNQNEVARAIELREIVTSLGPAYIKLGQALSIRPDILSPVAMTELQKLCDKVSSLLFFSLTRVIVSILKYISRSHTLLLGQYLLREFFFFEQLDLLDNFGLFLQSIREL